MAVEEYRAIMTPRISKANTTKFANTILIIIDHHQQIKDRQKLDLVQLCETQMYKFVLYGNIIFDTLEQSPFQKYATFWVFLALCHMLYLYICIFVYLYLYVLVFVCSAYGNMIFDILDQFSFQKYTTCWVFLALCHMLYLCILYLYFCICAFCTWEHNF